jgi:hypothetical protein
MVATSLEKLDPSTSRSAPALEPSEGEQDERYDERTDRVLHGDVSGARLEPREKRGKATRWNEPVHGGDGKEEDAKKSGDQRQGSVHRADVREDRKFSVTLPPGRHPLPRREALPRDDPRSVNSRPGPFDGSRYSARRLVRNRIPGPSSGVPVNSMPAASSADFMSTKLDVRLGGNPSNASYLFIVRPLTPDFWANCSIDHPTAARADRICTPVIIDNPPCVP